MGVGWNVNRNHHWDSQYKERIAESAVASSGRCVGGLAGAAAGQAAIPIPVVFKNEFPPSTAPSSSHPFHPADASVGSCRPLLGLALPIVDDVCVCVHVWWH